MKFVLFAVCLISSAHAAELGQPQRLIEINIERVDPIAIDVSNFEVRDKRQSIGGGVGLVGGGVAAFDAIGNSGHLTSIGRGGLVLAGLGFAGAFLANALTPPTRAAEAVRIRYRAPDGTLFQVMQHGRACEFVRGPALRTDGKLVTVSPNASCDVLNSGGQ